MAGRGGGVDGAVARAVNENHSAMLRPNRILIELFAPAPLGVVGMIAPGMVNEVVHHGFSRPLELYGPLQSVGLLLLFAYLFIGVQSLIYTIIMESLFTRGVDPASWVAVGISTLLGGLAGFSILVVVGAGASFSFGVVGLSVGFIIGTVVWIGSIPRSQECRSRVGLVSAGLGLFIGPSLAWAATRNTPPWVTMWAVAIAELYALKLLTLVGLWRTARTGRVAAYLFLWPGLDAEAFLAERDQTSDGALGTTRPTSELGWAAVKLGGGLTLFGWAAEHPTHVAAPWAGMIGIIFTLHFGLFHVLSWGWRRAGVVAQPLMRAPILSVSVAEFWGERWNVAFAQTARRYLLRPLARRWGVRRAGALVFLVSGLVHETVISLPARGGWGGPTAYFLLQAAGVGLEKSAAGRRLGLGEGWRGRVWMLLVTAGPLPLLLNPAFTERVIRPMLEAAGGGLK